MLSRNYGRLGKDINTGVSINSNIYNPVYEHQVECREPNIDATATLLFKVVHY